LISEGAKRGMAIANVDDINYDLMNYGRKFTIGDLQPIMGRMRREIVELIICIIGDDAAYDKVKRASEHNVGILTSCVKSSTINRRDRRTGDMDVSFVQNILLKINAKVGGVNQKMQKPIVSLLKVPFMVIGADVTHPSPDQTRIPSLVGMAASSDKNAFKYNCTWRIQSPTREMIDDFGEMVKVHLLRFKEVNKCFPHIILYYRDGVSDGQFDEVLQIEHQGLMKACAELEPDYKPAVTVIVVQKRHRIRLFPVKPEEGDGRNVNVKPGTIVDTEIVDMKKKQFYLVAHAAIQGVARPAKYQILHDDSEFTADMIQEVTHSLCHMFCRCNRTVSYVAPTYYAHLVAARGRSYVRG
jgi:eukaryotic translation initiation factor 2C